MEPILITAATGNVGAELVDLLAAQGQRVRAAVRNPATIRPGYAQDLVEYVPFDFTDPATFGPALRDVRKLFLVRPPALTDAQHQINPLIDAAQAAGVEQIVFLSLLGAERNHFVPHHAIESHLQSTGIAWTFLRAGFFMQNLSTTHQADIRDMHEIIVPAGRGQTSFIDTRDIATIAAQTLTTDGHSFHAYDLTGDTALDYYQVAAIFTAILGTPISYRQPSIWRFAQVMRARGIKPQFILVMIGIYTTARLGMAATTTTTTAELLGRAPRSLPQFVNDYRASWM